MSKSDCLRKLYKKLTGQEAKGESVCEILDEMIEAENLGGGVTSWNDLTDKPFDGEIKVIKDETSYTGTSTNLGYSTPYIVAGETYKVVFDGVEYLCEAYAESYYVYLGNHSIRNADRPNTGEPFFIETAALFAIYDLYSSDGEHTFSIAQVNIRKKMDEIYLPDSALKKNELNSALAKIGISPQIQANWNLNNEQSASFVKNRTHWVEYIPGEEIVSVSGNRITGDDVNKEQEGKLATTDMLFVSVNGKSPILVYKENDPRVDEVYFTLDIQISSMGTTLYFSLNFHSINGETINSVTVYEIGDTVYHKLDANYLPKAESVADVTAAPTAEQFNALLASLRNAGYLAE